MKLITGFFGFIFAVIAFTVITVFTTFVVLCTIDEYTKMYDVNFIVYIEKNKELSNP